MLDSIEIKNFKRIQGDDKSLILKNLAKVNYLVGKNGCGKSSVLEMIALSNEIKNPNFKLKKRFRKNRIKSKIPIFNIYIERPNIKYHLSKLSPKSNIKLAYVGEESKTYVYFSNDQKNYSVRTINKSISYLKYNSILFSSSL